MKHVVIPDGTEYIGERWFMNCQVESLTISASVTAIENEAFYNCKHLNCVIFAKDSRLEKIGSRCFYGTGIEKIVIPRGVEEIQDGAFSHCESLKDVIFE